MTAKQLYGKPVLDSEWTAAVEDAYRVLVAIAQAHGADSESVTPLEFHGGQEWRSYVHLPDGSAWYISLGKIYR